jgi:TctA family transporter
MSEAHSSEHPVDLKSYIRRCVYVFIAVVVAGFLMHLLSEKKMIYTTLAFTVFFFAGLMGLTIWAMHDFPTGTTH